MARIDIGIIGCGNISHSYLKGAARSDQVRVRSVADVLMEAAQEKAAEYGVQAVTLDRLLADPDIQIVINLTVPLAHAPVSLQVVEAGKHVYSEKPLVTRHAEAEALMLAAAAKGVRVGCAPDTFLGAGTKPCRRAIDAGRIGRPIAGSAFFATHGMEHWHPKRVHQSCLLLEVRCADVVQHERKQTVSFGFGWHLPQERAALN